MKNLTTTTQTALTTAQKKIAIFAEPNPAWIANVGKRTVTVYGIGSATIAEICPEDMRRRALKSKAYALMSMGEALHAMASENATQPLEKQLYAIPCKHYIAHNADGWADKMYGLLTAASKTYFGASVRDELVERAIIEWVKTNYAHLSLSEIWDAFGWGLKRKICAYGKLTVEFIENLLSQYSATRAAFLSAYEDEAKQTQAALEKAANAENRNEEAYAQAVAELEGLALENAKYQFYFQCPHYFVRRMVSEGRLQYEHAQKQQLVGLAKAYAAYDLLTIAQNDLRKKWAAFFDVNRIHPQKYDGAETKALQKYLPAIPEKSEGWEAYWQTHYCQLLYFHALAPYQKPRTEVEIWSDAKAAARAEIESKHGIVFLSTPEGDMAAHELAKLIYSRESKTTKKL